jgi:hypothetical protein
MYAFGKRHAIQHQALGTPVAGLQMLGNREGIPQWKSVEQVIL